MNLCDTMYIVYELLPEQHVHSSCCQWHYGWGAAAVAAAVAGDGGSW